MDQPPIRQARHWPKPSHPADYRPHLRALLYRLDAWVKDGKQPLASVYPRIDKKTLVSWRQDATEFSQPPRRALSASRPSSRPTATIGPDFLSKGIITKEPPDVLGQYTILVPKSDADASTSAACCLLKSRAARDLHRWNLRKKEVGAENMLSSLMGSYIPFPKTRPTA